MKLSRAVGLTTLVSASLLSGGTTIIHADVNTNLGTNQNTTSVVKTNSSSNYDNSSSNYQNTDNNTATNSIKIQQNGMSSTGKATESVSGVTFKLFTLTPKNDGIKNSQNVKDYTVSPNPIRTGKTNSGGELIFDNLPEGSYLVKQVKSDKLSDLARDVVVILPATDNSGTSISQVVIEPKNYLAPNGGGQTPPNKTPTNKAPKNSPGSGGTTNTPEIPSGNVSNVPGNRGTIMQTGTSLKNPWSFIVFAGIATLISIAAALWKHHSKIFSREKVTNDGK